MAVTPRPTVICPVYAAIPETISRQRIAIHVQYIRPPVVTTRKLPDTKRAKWPAISTDTSRSVEVEELRHRPQLFLQEEYALVLEDVADLAVGIEHVAELARAGRARLDARRIAAGACTLNAPRALLHDA